MSKERTVQSEKTLQPVTISIADSVALSGLGERTINKFIATGKLASVKCGRRRLVRRDSLMRLLEGGTDAQP